MCSVRLFCDFGVIVLVFVGLCVIVVQICLIFYDFVGFCGIVVGFCWILCDLGWACCDFCVTWCVCFFDLVDFDVDLI